MCTSADGQPPPSDSSILGMPVLTTADPNLCPYCGRGCSVALAPSMPAEVVKAYEAAGVHRMATCQAGATSEYAMYGASYADVIVARVFGVNRTSTPTAEVIRKRVEETIAKSKAARDECARLGAKLDQTMSKSRDLSTPKDAVAGGTDQQATDYCS